MSKRTQRIFNVIDAILFCVVVLLAIYGGCTGTVETSSGAEEPMQCYRTFSTTTTILVIGYVVYLWTLWPSKSMLMKVARVIPIVVSLIAIIVTTPIGMGICASPEMPCHTTKLAIHILLAISIVVAIVQIIWASKANKAGHVDTEQVDAELAGTGHADASE
jgi:hypothetical protein